MEPVVTKEYNKIDDNTLEVVTTTVKTEVTRVQYTLDALLAQKEGIINQRQQQWDQQTVEFDKMEDFIEMCEELGITGENPEDESGEGE